MQKHQTIIECACGAKNVITFSKPDWFKPITSEMNCRKCETLTTCIIKRKANAKKQIDVIRRLKWISPMLDKIMEERRENQKREAKGPESSLGSAGTLTGPLGSAQG